MRKRMGKRKRGRGGEYTIGSRGRGRRKMGKEGILRVVKKKINKNNKNILKKE
jgi:hypothetical protein